MCKVEHWLRYMVRNLKGYKKAKRCLEEWSEGDDECSVMEWELMACVPVKPLQYDWQWLLSSEPDY